MVTFAHFIYFLYVVKLDKTQFKPPLNTLASHKTHRRNGIGIRNKHRHFRVRCGKNGFPSPSNIFSTTIFCELFPGIKKLALVADNEFVALAQNHTSMRT